MAAGELLPPLAATMTVDPAARPVTSPVADTVATAVLLLDQDTLVPARAIPSESVAVSCTEPPIGIAAVLGRMVSVGADAVAAAVTVIAAVAVRPPACAVIVAAPAAMPVTSPVDDTATVLGLPLLQMTALTGSALPAASFAATESCSAVPTVSVAALGTTVSVGPVATTALVTVMTAKVLCGPAMAVMVVEPTARPLTSPVDDTLAVLVLLVIQVTVSFVSTLPSPSFTVALNCTVVPTGTEAELGVTVTLAMAGTTLTATVAVFPSLVTVMVAEPTPTARITPLAFTVAFSVSLLVKVIARPVRTVPVALVSVHPSGCVEPTASVVEVGVTATVATGALGPVASLWQATSAVARRSAVR